MTGNPPFGPPDELLPFPLQEGEAVFNEPWQAQVFALTVALHEKGHFTWPEWSQTLGAHRTDQEIKGVDLYFEAWLNALESMVITKNLGEANAVRELVEAWRTAYLTTPHGKPVELGGS